MQAQNESLVNFSSNLRRLIKEYGCQKKDLALSLRVSPTVVSNWLRGSENGGYYPHRKNLQNIADYFGISVNELLSSNPKKEESIEYWKEQCRAMQSEIDNLKQQLSAAPHSASTGSDEERLKDALKIIVDAVADLVAERRKLEKRDY